MNITDYQKIYSLRKIISYADIDVLSQYINEQGKILPRRITGLRAKEQKQITKSIKKARILSMLPFNSK